MILVTHIDLDGVGCEIVARHFFPSMVDNNIRHCNYHNVDYVVRNLLDTREENMVISDISVGEETASYIEQNHSHRVKLYDHHITAQKILDKYSWTCIDLKCSGTKLLFETFSRENPDVVIPDGLRDFVFHVDDYDLWHHKSPLSSNFNDMFYMLGRELFAATMIKRIQQKQPLISSADRRYLDGLDHRKNKYFAERVKSCKVIDNRMIIIASQFLSELSQYIRNIDPAPLHWKEVKYIDLINLEYGCHALRSYDPQFDVSLVASENGGGGHPRAAGYPIKNTEFSSWLAQL